MQYLVYDIGGSSIKYGLIDEMYTISDTGKIENTFHGAEAFKEAILSVYRVFSGRISGIGVSFCAELDPVSGQIHNAGPYGYLHGFKMKEWLSVATGLPVAVEKDAHCAMLAELGCGCLKDAESAIAVIVGSSIGFSFSQQGKIWHGARNYAGIASVMNADIREPFAGPMLTNRYTGWRALTEAYAGEAGLKPGTVDGEQFFKAYKAGNPAAARVLPLYCRTLANMIFNAQMLFDAQYIAVGGGISAEACFTDELKAQIHKIYAGMRVPVIEPEIRVCRFFNESNLIGAYEWLKKQEGSSAKA